MGFIRVSWILNMLTWHLINKERGDKSFIRPVLVGFHQDVMHIY